MARPREFDIDQAIDGAMEIFWRQGFKATNMPYLLMAMGLTRGSFYKAFEDKESVYFKTLEHYDEKVVTTTVAMLEGCTAAKASDCLMPLFSQSPKSGYGCFICNAMVEVAPENPKVAEKTQDMAQRLKTAIKTVLDKRNVGSSSAQRADLADVILHLYFGFQAMGKSGWPHEDWSERLKRLLEETAPA
ncbi:TetR/AcrR family transcriptional regulator [Shimia marina]|uniref:Copper outer membrane regulator n=1 Tax=Shimia marina TaxID=321267 RepID=A0A0P1F820_9RHOB|nr:TetR/AcrR family transcriptional regulator [Shimia marina]CUH51152.1 Copper outer membrane regulator [Shimia marina]SFD56670.1 transcriptional regulator, TetR family [Shimia marina]